MKSLEAMPLEEPAVFWRELHNPETDTITGIVDANHVSAAGMETHAFWLEMFLGVNHSLPYHQRMREYFVERPSLKEIIAFVRDDRRKGEIAEERRRPPHAVREMWDDCSAHGVQQEKTGAQDLRAIRMTLKVPVRHFSVGRGLPRSLFMQLHERIENPETHPGINFTVLQTVRTRMKPEFDLMSHEAWEHVRGSKKPAQS